jgi:hypothetical protein
MVSATNFLSELPQRLSFKDLATTLSAYSPSLKMAFNASIVV